MFFPEKSPSMFFQKKLKFLFEKFYFFSRILRQICYNLVIKKFTFGIVIFLKKFHIQNRHFRHFCRTRSIKRQLSVKELTALSG